MRSVPALVSNLSRTLGMPVDPGSDAWRSTHTLTGPIASWTLEKISKGLEEGDLLRVVKSEALYLR